MSIHSTFPFELHGATRSFQWRRSSRRSIDTSTSFSASDEISGRRSSPWPFVFFRTTKRISWNSSFFSRRRSSCVPGSRAPSPFLFRFQKTLVGFWPITSRTITSPSWTLRVLRFFFLQWAVSFAFYSFVFLPPLVGLVESVRLLSLPAF